MGRIYIVPHRRRREGKTDYRARLKLLKSGKPRLVIRKSINNIICHAVEYKENGDCTHVSAHSRELKKLGWKGGTGNLCSAYLTGLLFGAKAKKKGIKEMVLDMGLYRSTKANRVYAALKGVADAGVKVPCSEEILPKQDRLSGKHISGWAKKVKTEKPEAYEKMFSQYIKAGLEPENLEKHFLEVKEKILKA